MRAVQALSWRARSAIIAACAVCATLGAYGLGGVGAASVAASVTTPGGSGGGITTQIVLDTGGYTYCLDDKGQSTTEGTAVVLWTCDSSDPAQQWTFFPDGTIHPYVAVEAGDDVGLNIDTEKVTAKGSKGAAIIGPTTGANTGTSGANWTPRADGMLVNAGLTATDNAGTIVLNDRGSAVSNGTQLIAYPQSSVSANAHWWVKGAHYGTTKLVNVPDAGVRGGYWALDNATVSEMVVYVGAANSSGQGGSFEGSEVESGTFLTTPGGQQPNAAAGNNIGDAVPGTLNGSYTNTFTTDAWVTKSPGGTVSGMAGRMTAPDPVGFFSRPSDITGGSQDGQFVYTAKDCAGTEQNTQTGTNIPWSTSQGGWNNGASGVWTATGNITAPYPSGYPYPPAGSVACPG